MKTIIRRLYKRPDRGLIAVSRSLFAMCVISIAGCVYPSNTTFYEAVDQPRAEFNEGEEHIVNCPPKHYLHRRLGQTAVSVIPEYHNGGSQIKVYLAVPQGTALVFQSWNVRLTSLTDANVLHSIPLRFYMSCFKSSIEKCPKITTEQADGDGHHDRNFVGVADVPRELSGGFILELQEAATGQILDFKPQKFVLRTTMLLRGTFGCG